MPHEKIKHAYISNTFFENKPTLLILGTMYPCACKRKCFTGENHTVCFICDFFYGNEYTLWGILKDAFPNLKIDKRKDIKNSVESAEKIKTLLKNNNVAISDTILETKRNSEAPCSADDFIDGETKYNEELIEHIKKNPIDKIYFTSKKTLGFFAKIYKNKIGRKLPIAVTKQRVGTQFTLTKEQTVFNRDIIFYVLPSPSGNGVRKEPIAYQNAHVIKNELTYSQWREGFYKESFKDVFN